MGVRYEIKPQWDASPPKNHVVRERKGREDVMRLIMNAKCKEKVGLTLDKLCSNIKQTTYMRRILEESTKYVCRICTIRALKRSFMISSLVGRGTNNL